MYRSFAHRGRPLPAPGGLCSKARQTGSRCQTAALLRTKRTVRTLVQTLPLCLAALGRGFATATTCQHALTNPSAKRTCTRRAGARGRKWAPPVPVGPLLRGGPKPAVVCGPGPPGGSGLWVSPCRGPPVWPFLRTCRPPPGAPCRAPWVKGLAARRSSAARPARPFGPPLPPPRCPGFCPPALCAVRAALGVGRPARRFSGRGAGSRPPFFLPRLLSCCGGRGGGCGPASGFGAGGSRPCPPARPLGRAFFAGAGPILLGRGGCWARFLPPRQAAKVAKGWG